jgi:hypothetical protein
MVHHIKTNQWYTTGESEYAAVFVPRVSLSAMSGKYSFCNEGLIGGVPITARQLGIIKPGKSCLLPSRFINNCVVMNGML